MDGIDLGYASSALDITADLTPEAYMSVCQKIREQPKWRGDSNVDADYYDGSQISSEVARRLKEAGIPPQDSNLIKPTINAVLGLEARSRTDYKVASDDDSQDEIAEALSAKIKEVENESRADRAMSDAYSSMIRTGIGWVEVSREFDPLKYPYRVREVHRNDIYWDWTAREPDLSDARYLRRDKWVDRLQAQQMFPEDADVVSNVWNGWNNLDIYNDQADTRMVRAYENEQTWGRLHDEFINRNSGMVRLSELWYRHYEEALVLWLPTGQAVEYQEGNPYHEAALAQGVVQVQKAMVPRVRLSMWIGPHKLMDVPSPLPHKDFPYVPFWCFRKDRSRVPYGLVRDMRGPQDQIIDLDILLYEVLNSVKVEVDNDALDLNQNTYQEVAQNLQSLRSLTVLNANRRNANGFRVTREHALAAQVFQLVQERKKRIEEVGGVYRAMLGQSTEASSGVAINNLVEQGSTTLAEVNDNFRYARRLVGQQLLAFVKQDLIGRPSQISVQQGAARKVVYINREVMTPQGPTVQNDIASAMVKVVLEDIPSTPTFRAQQLQAFSQIVTAAPPAYQAVLYPAMLELSDVPNRHEIADQLRKVGNVPGNLTPEQEQQQAQIAQQQQALQMQAVQLGLDEKQAQIDKLRAEVEKMRADSQIKAEQVHTDATIRAESLTIQQQKQALDERTADANLASQNVKFANNVNA